jgi:hypothetical protein
MKKILPLSPQEGLQLTEDERIQAEEDIQRVEAASDKKMKKLVEKQASNMYKLFFSFFFLFGNEIQLTLPHCFTEVHNSFQCHEDKKPKTYEVHISQVYS